MDRKGREGREKESEVRKKERGKVSVLVCVLRRERERERERRDESIKTLSCTMLLKHMKVIIQPMSGGLPIIPNETKHHQKLF